MCVSCRCVPQHGASWRVGPSHSREPVALFDQAKEEVAEMARQHPSSRCATATSVQAADEARSCDQPRGDIAERPADASEAAAMAATAATAEVVRLEEAIVEAGQSNPSSMKKGKGFLRQSKPSSHLPSLLAELQKARERRDALYEPMAARLHGALKLRDPQAANEAVVASVAFGAGLDSLRMQVHEHCSRLLHEQAEAEASHIIDLRHL
eukprot:SAG11_NODE_5769_length_1466_cov_2.130944_1_plen_210_part_00